MDLAANVVGAVLLRNGRILLGRRNPSKRDAPSCWDLIGGRVEPGEAFEEACIREIAEELAVEAELDVELMRTTAPTGVEYRIFRVTNWSGEPRVANEEHTEIGWFSLKQACELRPLASEEYVALFRALAASLP